jgi:calcineurin-like phosphoesterase family protein
MTRPKVFFTSDTHFGHKNIIRHCKRPFDDVDEMDKCLIENWNRVVSNDDTVYHLGDFAWHSVKQYREKLNGNITLILGNHDKQKIEGYRGIFDEVTIYKKIKIFEQKLILFHYPILSWDGRNHKSWHLYGHVHEKVLAPMVNIPALNIGTDNWGFTPIEYEQIEATMNDIVDVEKSINDVDYLNKQLFKLNEKIEELSQRGRKLI